MEWDPTIIRKFREEFGLSKSDMIRQFQRRGLEMLNWSLYDR